jgi:hypothetical protein
VASPEPLGTIPVGSFVLEVGGPAGTVIREGDGEAAALADALAEWQPPGPATEPPTTALEDANELLDEAATATGKVERTLKIGEGAAAGDLLDPALLGLEADMVLDLLERLDRNGKAKEALQLARALSKLYALARRWAELLRALRAALRAGEILGDLSAIGWAKHELGTLRLAGGDVEGAERFLGEAREIRRGLGDREGLAVTEQNLRVLEGRLRPAWRRGPRRWLGAHGHPLRLAPALVAGTLVFAVGIAAGTTIGHSGGGSRTVTINEAGTGKNKTATETTAAAKTVTETETVTVPQVETVTETVTEVVKAPVE